MLLQVAFSSDFSQLWAGKDLGLKHAKMNGSLHELILLSFKGIQKQFEAVLPYQVCL